MIPFNAHHKLNQSHLMHTINTILTKPFFLVSTNHLTYAYLTTLETTSCKLLAPTKSYSEPAAEESSNHMALLHDHRHHSTKHYKGTLANMHKRLQCPCLANHATHVQTSGVADPLSSYIWGQGKERVWQL